MGLLCFSVPTDKGTAEEVLAGARHALAEAKVKASSVNADRHNPQQIVVRTSDMAGASAALTAKFS